MPGATESVKPALKVYAAKARYIRNMAVGNFSNIDDIIIVRAMLSLPTSENGGRKTPALSGYRPNHVFEYFETGRWQTHIGEIQLPDEDGIAPGEEQEVTVYFMNSPFTRPYRIASLVATGGFMREQNGSGQQQSGRSFSSLHTSPFDNI